MWSLLKKAASFCSAGGGTNITHSKSLSWGLDFFFFYGDSAWQRKHVCAVVERGGHLNWIWGVVKLFYIWAGFNKKFVTLTNDFVNDFTKIWVIFTEAVLFFFYLKSNLYIFKYSNQMFLKRASVGGWKPADNHELQQWARMKKDLDLVMLRINHLKYHLQWLYTVNRTYWQDEQHKSPPTILMFRVG